MEGESVEEALAGEIDKVAHVRRRKVFIEIEFDNDAVLQLDLGPIVGSVGQHEGGRLVPAWLAGNRADVYFRARSSNGWWIRSRSRAGVAVEGDHGQAGNQRDSQDQSDRGDDRARKQPGAPDAAAVESS